MPDPWEKDPPLNVGEPFDDGSFFDDNTGFLIEGEDDLGDWVPDPPPQG